MNLVSILRIKGLDHLFFLHCFCNFFDWKSYMDKNDNFYCMWFFFNWTNFLHDLWSLMDHTSHLFLAKLGMKSRRHWHMHQLALGIATAGFGHSIGHLISAFSGSFGQLIIMTEFLWNLMWKCDPVELSQQRLAEMLVF